VFGLVASQSRSGDMLPESSRAIRPRKEIPGGGVTGGRVEVEVDVDRSSPSNCNGDLHPESLSDVMSSPKIFMNGFAHDSTAGIVDEQRAVTREGVKTLCAEAGVPDRKSR
jgi:hypothetical protein